MPSVVERRSYGSVQVFWLNRAEAVRRCAEAGRRLVAACPEVRSVHLFGSLASGRAVPGSDADILVLLERCELRWLDRPPLFAPHFAGVGLGVDLFCYTASEAEGNPFARRALAEGMCLAARRAPPPDQGQTGPA